MKNMIMHRAREAYEPVHKIWVIIVYVNRFRLTIFFSTKS